MEDDQRESGLRTEVDVFAHVDNTGILSELVRAPRERSARTRVVHHVRDICNEKLRVRIRGTLGRTLSGEGAGCEGDQQARLSHGRICGKETMNSA